MSHFRRLARTVVGRERSGRSPTDLSDRRYRFTLGICPRKVDGTTGALVALFFAGRRIFRPAQVCGPGEVCAVPRTRQIYKLVFGIVSVLVLIALVFPYVVKFFY